MLEYQLVDRRSFLRFLDLTGRDLILDTKTIGYSMIVWRWLVSAVKFPSTSFEQ